MDFNNSIVEVCEAKQVKGLNATKRGIFDIQIKGTTYQDTVCLLYTDYMILKIKHLQRFIYLKVTLTFTLLFTNYLQNHNHHIMTIILQKQGDSLTIRSKTPQELDPFKSYFQRNIKQTGFHQTFKAIKKIGKGNFATVYLVQNKENEKRYAVKAFSKECINSEEKGKQSLMNEINVIKKLSHKNLMKMHSMYETQHSIYLVLQLLQGGSLSDRLKQKQKMMAFETKIIMKNILQGLEVMHSHKIMHRDIKPQNILFRRENDVNCIIADFGLAQFAQSPEYLFVRCGTPGFVAPQIANLKDRNEKYGVSCDIFSAGVIMHLLLIKQTPFAGKNYDEVLRLNRACSFNFQHQKYQQLPSIQLDLLKKMLEKDPNKRITANQALSHQYFRNQLLPSLQISKLKLLTIEPRFLKENCPLNVCYGDKKVLQRNQFDYKMIREDSCLKFSMKENIAQKKGSPNSLKSVGKNRNVCKINGSAMASRFKKIADST